MPGFDGNKTEPGGTVGNSRLKACEAAGSGTTGSSCLGYAEDEESDDSESVRQEGCSVFLLREEEDEEEELVDESGKDR